MIEIKDISGKTRFSTPINKGAKGKFTLMKEDYIVLPFSVPEPIYFKLGDYVDLSGVLDDSLGGLLSKVYEVTDLQKPSFNASTGGYDYELKLDAYYWKWKNKIFKYTPEHAGYEASWSLTAALDVQLGVFLRNLKALGYTYKGKEFVFEIDSTVENKAVAMTYDNMNLLDALFSMAGEDKWNCDCWITDNVIHFGRNEFGDSVKIELGVEASAMTRSESKGTYATRIYAFGSTRNIPENYRLIEEQTVVNGVVQRRLMLPADTPYIDVYPDMSQEEAIEDIVIFDEVYPRLESTMSEVSTRTENVTNEDGNQETVTYYRYHDTSLNFSKDYILPGQELTIIFQSGKMNGLEFGVIFDPDNNGSQLWEIVRSEDYGRPLPDDTIYPENDDKYILSGFDPKFVSAQMIPDAEKELKEKAQKVADQRKKDDGTYYATLRSEWVNKDKLKRFFEFGQKINLVNKAFFENGRESRVIGWEFYLDIPWDSPVYTIGESMPYSRLNDMEEKLESITYKGHTYVGGGGSSIYVIKTNDSTAPSDSNVFSAKRSLATLLRKDKEDQTNYLIKLLGGIISPFLKSPDFVTGGLGAGFTLKQNEDGTSYAEVDRLLVRMKAVFQVLEIMKTELGGASFLFNSSGARVEFTKVEQINYRVCFSDGKPAYTSDGKALYLNSVYRCWFLADDGDTAVTNKFKVGDLVRSQTFDIKEGVHENVSNHYWWRKVVGVGDDYIDLYSVEASADSDIPKAGDVAVQLGNESDTDRQSAIVLSAYGDGAPYMTFYQGINSYSLSGKDVFSVGYDKVKQACYFRVYGSTYIGAKDESSYISFDPTTNKMRIKAEVEITSGSGFGNLTDAPDIDAINQDIKDAQSAANAAKADAEAAKADLTNFKSDNIISPVEKTALKQQLADINSEYSQIVANANKYSISISSYTTAYNLAKTALTKYTASSPEYISIGSDYNNISAYYTARQTILDTIATKAKDYADSIGDSAKEDVAKQMGYSSYADMVAKAEAGSTIIKGGKINTELIETENLKISGSIFTPLFRITSSNFNNYVVSKGSYNQVNIGSTGFNVQFEYYDESASPLPLYPIVTKDLLGCNVKIFNYTTNSIPVRYGRRSTSNTSPILTMVYNNLLSGGYIELLLIQNGEYSSSLPDNYQFTYILTSHIGLEYDA